MAFVDFVMLLLVIIFLFYGFFKGMLKVGLAIVTFYLSVIVASLYFRLVAQKLAKNSTTSLQVLEMLSFLVVLVVIYLILLWAAFYTFRYVQVGGRIQYLDKLIGSFLGLVLGDLMEKYLYRSVASYGLTWLTRPAVIVLFALAALSLFFTLRGRMKASAKAREAASPASFSGAMARSEDES